MNVKYGLIPVASNTTAQLIIIHFSNLLDRVQRLAQMLNKIIQ